MKVPAGELLYTGLGSAKAGTRLKKKETKMGKTHVIHSDAELSIEIIEKILKTALPRTVSIRVIEEKGEQAQALREIFHQAFPGREVDFKPFKPSGEFGMRRFQ